MPTAKEVMYMLFHYLTSGEAIWFDFSVVFFVFVVYFCSKVHEIFFVVNGDSKTADYIMLMCDRFTIASFAMFVQALLYTFRYPTYIILGTVPIFFLQIKFPWISGLLYKKVRVVKGKDIEDDQYDEENDIGE